MFVWLLQEKKIFNNTKLTYIVIQILNGVSFNHFKMDPFERHGLMYLQDKPSGSILLHFYCFIITILSTIKAIFLGAKHSRLQWLPTPLFYMLFVSSCYILMCHFLLPVSCYLLVVTPYLLLVNRYSLLIIHYLLVLLVTCYSLLVTCNLLLVTCYLLLLTCY